VLPNSFAAWMVAIRPRSLLIAISPVLVGAAMGYQRVGAIDLLSAVLALVAALLMQLITNLQNDVGYTQRGAEVFGTRVGLPRATAKGWLGVRQVRVAIVILCAVAVSLGLALVALRGWPVLVMGSASLLAALAYMGGPKPIAYTPWGEFTVFVFFGLVAVLGTDWLLTGHIGALTWLAAVSMGCLAAAALLVNNHRDRTHDAQVGRNTFAVLWGERRSQVLFGALLALPLVSQGVMAVLAGQLWFCLPWLLVPVVWRLHRDFVACPPGLPFNGILFRVFQLELGFAALLAMGAMLAAHPHAGV
jgi:1,4-dihydroxy-2-naphthoate polyprenyltransferase